MTTLLIAEHDNGSLKESTARALTAALALGAGVDILVAGFEARPAAEAAARLTGVERVLLAEAEWLRHGLAEPLGLLLVDLAPGYDAIAAPATTNGKNILPRLAALLDMMQVSDVTKVLGPNSFERPIYAGNAVETVETTDAKILFTVRTSAFRAALEGGAAPIVLEARGRDPGLSEFLGETLSSPGQVELSAAKIVVAGGRGLGSAENFSALIGALAGKLGAAIGASRAAVDAGYAGNDCQVGQTGKVVAPELYIACGISGAIQHLAGMKDSRVIVAINKDAEAPIFAVADYGLVGDLFLILPELEKAL